MTVWAGGISDFYVVYENILWRIFVLCNQSHSMKVIHHFYMAFLSRVQCFRFISCHQVITTHTCHGCRPPQRYDCKTRKKHVFGWYPFQFEYLMDNIRVLMKKNQLNHICRLHTSVHPGRLITSYIQGWYPIQHGHAIQYAIDSRSLHSDFVPKRHYRVANDAYESRIVILTWSA